VTAESAQPPGSATPDEQGPWRTGPGASPRPGEGPAVASGSNTQEQRSGRLRPRTEFKNYRGAREPKFVNESELECAEILDFYGLPWEYEPTTFVLETDETGRVTEAFSPDFYLPEQNLFLEVTTMRQELVTRKNRKVRKLREKYPNVNVKLFYKRDIEALGQKLKSRQFPAVSDGPAGA
jgi:hypothetical protein